MDKAGSLNKGSVFRGVIRDEFGCVANFRHSIALDLLDKDRCGYDRLDSVVASPAVPERVGIDLVYDVPSSICISETRCIDSASLINRAGKTGLIWRVWAVDRVTECSANTMRSIGVIRRCAEIQQESAVILVLVR